MHHFSDASVTGYGQCSYSRVVNNDGDVHCSLVFSKARVTPSKVITIPRLELNAAVVAVKIGNVLKNEMREDYDHHFWTDSQIVLRYISNDAKRFKVYVANRVQHIRDSTTSNQWHYIRSRDNPADHASRGLYVEDLESSSWFNGPSFLWEPQLPVDMSDPDTNLKDDPELKQVKATEATEESVILGRLERFSDWNRAVMGISQLIRFIRVRKKQNSVDMIDIRAETESFILRSVQKEAFASEIEQLKKDPSKGLSRTSRIYKLDPFVDDSGLLRVGGRIDRSSLAYHVRHPIILPNPKSCSVAELIIKHHHERAKHQGRGFTVNELKANGYWILGCTRAVASHIFKCVTCRKLRAQNQGEKMADLPPDRLELSPPSRIVELTVLDHLLSRMDAVT